jgi:hypothetical protein
MGGGCRRLLSSRFQHRWVHLFLLWALGGCANPTLPPRSSRTLRAMSDGPSFNGESPSSSVQGYNVPGRSPNSQMPWEFFLGNAAHRLIAYMYGVDHPQNEVFYNQVSLFSILSKVDIGDPSRLLQNEMLLRPDITDVSLRQVFEIKPQGEAGLQEGRQAVQTYIAALNRAVRKRRPFSGGIGFQGQILIRFAQGQYIWRLEWQTPEPGVIQYRWTRSQQRFASGEAAYDAGQWVDLTVQELAEYGGWVAQAVEGMVTRRERLASFSGAVGVVIEIVGDIAVGVFSGALSPRSGAQGPQRPSVQPPSQGGGQVIPFPSRAAPLPPPVSLPAASGR